MSKGNSGIARGGQDPANVTVVHGRPVRACVFGNDARIVGITNKIMVLRRVHGELLEGHGSSLGIPEAPPGGIGNDPGPPWGCFGASIGRPWGCLGASQEPLGNPRSALTCSWGSPGDPWVALQGDLVDHWEPSDSSQGELKIIEKL